MLTLASQPLEEWGGTKPYLFLPEWDRDPDTAIVSDAAEMMRRVRIGGTHLRIKGGPQSSLSQTAKVTGSSATAHLKEYAVTTGEQTKFATGKKFLFL